MGTGSHIDNEHMLQEDLQLKLEEEEIRRKQREKQHWLKNGDKNTNFYHLHANKRRKTNLFST